MAIKIEERGTRVYAIGNTYPIREDLKEAGCRWDARQKAWWCKPINRDRLEAVIAHVPETPEKAPESTEPKVSIGGNTYPVRDKLRALGGKYVPEDKTWLVPASKEKEAQEIVANAPREFRPTKCKLCGAVPNERGWPRIYRNGLCSDCYADRDY